MRVRIGIKIGFESHNGDIWLWFGVIIQDNGIFDAHNSCGFNRT